MINILIVTDCKYRCKDIVNNCFILDSNFRISNIAHTGKEAITLIRKNKIDIILLDEKISDMNLKKLINKITIEDSKKYEKSFIILGDSKEMILNSIDEKYILDIIPKPTDYEKLLQDIKSFGNNKEKKDIYEKINKELEKLHFKFSYYGTKYLTEVIYEIYCRNNKLDLNFSKEIYTVVGKKCGKAANTIHSAIKKSITSMYYDCDEETFNKYFNVYENERPKLKEIVYKIVDNIK